MTIADKLATVAANEQRVYEAGKQDEYNRFWDAYQLNGSRSVYTGAFSGQGWTDETFKPKYNINVSGGASYMFYYNRVPNIKNALQNAGVTLNLSGASNISYLFNSASTSELPELDLSNASNVNYLFDSCSRLETIYKIITSSTTPWVTNCFKRCTALKNVVFEGVISKTGLSFQDSTELTIDSLVSILEALEDKGAGTSGTAWLITIGETNKAKLTEDQLNIARNKGWTVN